MTQLDKAIRFQALHRQDKAFVIANPWDAGTARILTSLGFEAMATTSAGLAFSLGRRDAEGALTRNEILANAKLIVEATDLPVSADLENGFGDTPEVVAETIHLAAECGLVGGSIEDATGRKEHPIYDFSLSVERIAAAVESARKLPFPFILVARAENFLHDKPDLEETIRRLQAYEVAGADVLFAPGLPSAEAIREVCSAVTKPVNVVMGLRGYNYTMSQLTELGVKRVSLGSSFSRAALSGLINAAREIINDGTFSFANNTVSFDETNSMMAESLGGRVLNLM